MRILKEELTKNRKKKILQAAVSHYISTDKPVSSRIISSKYGLKLSPATIRNIMSSLEKDGMLKHVHTSSGCIPTDKGYRSFVDSLIELQDLAVNERKHIIEEYKTRMREVDELLVHTSHLLSVISNCIGFVLEPKLEKSRLRSLQLLKISDYEILVLIITKSGLLKHKTLKLNDPVDDGLVADISYLLNEKLRGTTLSELMVRIPEIADQIRHHKSSSDAILSTLSSELFRKKEDNIYLEGTSNILSMVKTKDYNKMQTLMQVMEHKQRLAELLEEDLDSIKETRVSIGKELKLPEFEDLSLIKTAYKIEKNPVGILGIIGPKRMEYSKMISLVNFVANTVNRIIQRLSSEKKK